MQSESAIENHAPVRGRRRKRGSGAVDGPVFVDNSGRRARMLRRIGTLVGVVCLGYAVVLGMAFMGWGTSLTPSSLLPFDGGRAGSAPGGGNGIQPGGIAPSGAPTGTPPSGPPTGSAPSSAPTTTAGASASTGAN
ncbi:MULTISPECIES: hypothetical protein [unclassified Streptomyces]|uniref:hypothetical protein n=1 Tax=unclassified Streptomyces TaxID=2593676 RepID=UPI00224FFA44|nr:MULTISPECIES: hypothetical protein [unclassified Streptomyces]MCX4989209.1 hypothetical protein [Streptomyces sp. NBC_00568]MCX5005570.1 hypothetical protein [Streptomyces sp. NBC_00638]